MIECHTLKSMDECTTTVNDFIDTCDEVTEEQSWIRAKLADLDDRSCRNKVKLCGVPEAIVPADLCKYAKELIHAVLPDASPRDLIINQIHRIAKPLHLAASIYREILMRLHFFHIKERILMCQQGPNLHCQLRMVTYSFFQISQNTLPVAETTQSNYQRPPQSYNLFKW